MMMTIESIWPEWKQEKVIGKGSYGTVYKCCREVNGEKEYSAIKVISIPQDELELAELSTEGMTAEQTREYYRDIVSEFMSEISILESLRGEKNIVNIQEYAVKENENGIGWNIFIRMELLSDFNTYSCDKAFTEKDVMKLAQDLCSALLVCEKHKIIHRDIKPENIFADRDGNFKLGDFGVARQLEKTNASMSMKGTYNYMAPEVYKSKKYDSRADIYSLGLVMYRLLNNNRMPFIDPDRQLIKYSERQAAFERRLSGEKIPPIENISDKMNQVILKACAFDPEDRYKTVEEFSEALRSLMSAEKGKARTVKSNRLKGMIAALIAAAVIIPCAVGFALHSKSDADIPSSEEAYSDSATEDGQQDMTEDFIPSSAAEEVLSEADIGNVTDITASETAVTDRQLSEKEKIYNAYLDVLENVKKDYFEDYYVYDIDCNGVPELIVNGVEESHRCWYVFTYDGGIIKTGFFENQFSGIYIPKESETLILDCSKRETTCLSEIYIRLNYLKESDDFFMRKNNELTDEDLEFISSTLSGYALKPGSSVDGKFTMLREVVLNGSTSVNIEKRDFIY